MENLNSLNNREKISFKATVKKLKDKISSFNSFFAIKLYLWWDLSLIILVGSIIIIIQYYKNISFIDHLVEHFILSIEIWFVVMVLRNIIQNYIIRTLPHEFSIEFFKLLKNAINDYKLRDSKLGSQKILETVSFLRASNSRTGKGLEFIPDNKAINNLFKIEALVALTEANPSEWLNPTYNFYLINDYITNFYRTYAKHPDPKLIDITQNRDQKMFSNFCKDKKETLIQISNLTEENNLVNYLTKTKKSIRFYFISKNQILENKSTIETLIAGHDLFGCFLYFINPDKIRIHDYESQENIPFYELIRDIGYKLEENSGKIDLAIAALNHLNVIFRKQDALVQKELNNHQSWNVQQYLVNLCKLLVARYDDSDYLLNNFINDATNEFVFNNEYCHIFVDNKK